MASTAIKGDAWGGHGAPVGDSVFLRILRHNGIFVQAADLKWLITGHNHLSTYPKYPQGMFTIRTWSNNRAPTIGDSIACGYTHGVFTWTKDKLDREHLELILDAWLVDLVLCKKMFDTAEKASTNRSDGNKFLIFDPNKPAVSLFSRRLIIPR